MRTKILITTAALIFSAALFAATPGALFSAPTTTLKHEMHGTKSDGEKHGMKKPHGNGKHHHKGKHHKKCCEHTKCCHHAKGKH